MTTLAIATQNPLETMVQFLNGHENKNNLTASMVNLKHISITGYWAKPQWAIIVYLYPIRDLVLDCI